MSAINTCIKQIPDQHEQVPILASTFALHHPPLRLHRKNYHPVGNAQRNGFLPRFGIHAAHASASHADIPRAHQSQAIFRKETPENSPRRLYSPRHFDVRRHHAQNLRLRDFRRPLLHCSRQHLLLHHYRHFAHRQNQVQIQVHHHRFLRHVPYPHNGPLSAINVTHRVWINSVKAALVEEGYNKFPLNDEDSREFINRLEAKNNIPHIKMVLSRIQTLNIRGDKELAQYVDHGIVILHIDSPHHTKKQASVLKAYIREPKDNYFNIPQNVSKVSYFYKTFRQEDYEFRNDTLFFQLKPQKLDKTLNFFVTKEALEQKNVRFLETEGAKIGVEKLDVNIIKDDKKESYFNIHGFLFLE